MWWRCSKEESVDLVVVGKCCGNIFCCIVMVKWGMVVVDGKRLFEVMDLFCDSFCL